MLNWVHYVQFSDKFFMSIFSQSVSPVSEFKWDVSSRVSCIRRYRRCMGKRMSRFVVQHKYGRMWVARQQWRLEHQCKRFRSSIEERLQRRRWSKLDLDLIGFMNQIRTYVFQHVELVYLLRLARRLACAHSPFYIQFLIVEQFNSALLIPTLE